MLKVEVTIYNPDGSVLTNYVMDHDDDTERRRLGEGCRNAFEAGQSVRTVPMTE